MSWDPSRLFICQKEVLLGLWAGFSTLTSGLDSVAHAHCLVIPVFALCLFAVAFIARVLEV